MFVGCYGDLGKLAHHGESSDSQLFQWGTSQQLITWNLLKSILHAWLKTLMQLLHHVLNTTLSWMMCPREVLGRNALGSRDMRTQRHFVVTGLFRRFWGQEALP